MAEYVQDDATVNRVIQFFERFVRHVKGEWYGRPFNLLEWQVEDIIRPLFGQKRVTGDMPVELMPRRYTTVYCEIAKKNGKSALLSGLGCWFLRADGEPGAEVYSVAGDTEQAGIVFSSAKAMVEQSPQLSRDLRLYRNTIRYEGKDSFWRVLSSDARTKHGYNPHAILFDELHVQPNRELWDTLVQGVAARRQPVVFAITTAGWYDPESICWEQHDYALKVKDGIIEDDTFLPVIYAADRDDDWTDPVVWRKANPSLGITVKTEFLEKECAVAREVPAKQNTFRRLHLNQWTEQETRWLDMGVWDENGDHGDMAIGQLAGQECYAGLDLSTTTDISALALYFHKTRDVVMRFWVPGDNIQKRSHKDRVPYDAWRRDGLITATPGNVIDYDFIRAEINELGRTYNIRQVAIDRWNATQLATQLAGDGFDIVEFGQGFASMSAPTKELETVLLARRLRHGANPVLRWMASNVAVKEDPAGNLKPDKSKSSERIDGIVALIMALGLASKHEGNSFDDRYADEGLLVLG